MQIYIFDWWAILMQVGSLVVLVAIIYLYVLLVRALRIYIKKNS